MGKRFPASKPWISPIESRNGVMLNSLDLRQSAKIGNQGRPIPFNSHAIDADKLDQINVKQNQVSGFPFDLGNSPVTIEIPVVGVKGWKLEEDRYTPALPEKVVPEEAESRMIELVPYGSTTLRLTTFPVYSE